MERRKKNAGVGFNYYSVSGMAGACKHVFKWRLDSDIESKSFNKTYFNEGYSLDQIKMTE